jgi:hypothetical protein
MKKHVKKMLLVGGALVATPLAACGGPIANPKGCFYDDGVYVDQNGQPCGVQDSGSDVSDANPFGDSSVKDASSDAPADAATDAPGDAASDAPSDDGG